MRSFSRPPVTSVVTIGDSTLDNSHLIQTKVGQRTIIATLLDMLAEPRSVVDLAVEGFTTQDVLQGAFRNKVVTDDEHDAVMFKPLEKLAQLQNSSVEYPPTHIILSVGGEDIREALNQCHGIGEHEGTQKMRVLISQMQANYKQIIFKIREACPQAKIVILLPYAPSLTFNSDHVYSVLKCLVQLKSNSLIAPEDLNKAALNELYDIMMNAYRPIVEQAAQEDMCMPMIDLATSFDPADPDLYISHHQPSAKGGQLIAKLVLHVMTYHEFNESTRIYCMPTGLKGPIVSMATWQEWRPCTVPLGEMDAGQYFHAKYQARLEAEREKYPLFFGWLLTRSRVNPEMSMMNIVRHAQEGGDRSLGVLQEMGWMDDQKRLR